MTPVYGSDGLEASSHLDLPVLSVPQKMFLLPLLTKTRTLRPQTTYEATSSTVHPNPISLLPPALLHALALATAHKEHDPAFSSFLT